jgi:hypothetical protein
MIWREPKKAPRNTVVIALGQLQYQGKSIISDAIFDGQTWWRSNGGYGYTVSFYVRGWIPIPKDTVLT